MVNFLAVLSVSLALLKAASSQPPGTATFTCTNPGGVNTLTVTYVFDTVTPPDLHNALFAKEFGSTAPCNEKLVATPAAITTQLQVTIPLGSPACGITAAGNTLAGAATFYLTKREDDILDSTDFMLEIQPANCDFTNIFTSTPTISSIAASGDLTGGAINLLAPLVELSLVADGASGVDINACVLGQDVKLKLTLDLGQGGVTGVHATQCTAQQVGGPAAGPLTFLDTSCTNGLLGSSAVAATGGFTYDATLSLSNTYISVLTSKFDCFRWDGSTTISISCTVEFCTSDIAAPVGVALGNLCQAGADTCDLVNPIIPGRTLSSRKRRDTGQEHLNEAEISLTINIGPSTGNQDRNKPFISSCPNHIHNSVFIAIVAILGGLLLVAMAMTCFLAFRLRRSARNDDKGIDNPSF